MTIRVISVSPAGILAFKNRIPCPCGKVVTERSLRTVLASPYHHISVVCTVHVSAIVTVMGELCAAGAYFRFHIGNESNG